MLTSYSGLFKTSSLPSQVKSNDMSGTEIRQKKYSGFVIIWFKYISIIEREKSYSWKFNHKERQMLLPCGLATFI